MNIRKFLALLLAVSLLMLPACSGEERSKSVEEAETYDDLTMDFEDEDDEDKEDEDEEHERWRDKEVDKFKTAEEYADYYHDEYIALYMEQYYYEDDYDEGTMLEQSYLDAIDHWEKNQLWPGPKK